MGTAFEQSPAPGINKTVLNAGATGTSPLAVALPVIPAYGRYLAVVTGWFGNNGDRGYAWFLVDYYKASTSNAVLAVQQIGTTTVTSGQQLTGLAMTGVASTGVLTVTLTSTRGSNQGNAQVELFELSSVLEQYGV